MVTDLSSACFFNSETTRSTIPFMAQGRNVRFNLPDSILERSKRSSIKRANRSESEWMTCRNSLACPLSSKAHSKRVSAYPLIIVTGVLSSWDTLATKSCRTLSRRLSSVISWNTNTAPSTLSSLNTGVAWTNSILSSGKSRDISQHSTPFFRFNTSSAISWISIFRITSRGFLPAGSSLMSKKSFKGLFMSRMPHLASTTITPSDILKRTASNRDLLAVTSSIRALICSAI